MEVDIAGTQVAVVGHSFIRRLKDDLDMHYYYESNPNFDLHQCTVSLKGSGGWHVLDRNRFEASFKPFLWPGVVARSEACSLGMQAAPSLIPTSGTFFRGDLVMKTFLGSFSPLIQEEQLSVIVERMCTKY